MSRRASRRVFYGLAALLALYLGAPLAALFARSGAADWGELWRPATLAALGTSAVAATISTAFIAACGVPLGYVLARSGARWAKALGVLVQVPLALPPLSGGILLLFLFGPYTFLGGLFGGRLTDSLAGVVLAQCFVAAPFGVIAARSAFAALDPALEGVAATLGRTAGERWRQVVLPLAGPGVAAGLLLAWVRAFGEFGATAIVAYHPYTLPVLIWVEFGSTGLNAVLPLVAAAMAAAALALAFATLLLSRRRRPARVSTRRDGPALVLATG
ncbi:MAG TPA: ABC transporter permease subunit, partial [Limnochordia bacterium]|nr:ABC transporter permease subunit [Limnochordia bacterium]